MEEELLPQDDRDDESSHPGVLFQEYLQQMRSLAAGLDDFELRCRFTTEIIDFYIQEFITLQDKMKTFKTSLPVRERQRIHPLIRVIRHVLPRLVQAQKERAKFDEMTIKCHDYITTAVNALEKVLDTFR